MINRIYMGKNKPLIEKAKTNEVSKANIITVLTLSIITKLIEYIFFSNKNKLIYIKPFQSIVFRRILVIIDGWSCCTKQ